MNRFAFASLNVALTALAVLTPRLTEAAPALRKQLDQHGDFVLIGNTLGQDCAMGVPAPTVGTVNACGMNTADTAPDVYWESEDPDGTSALASTAITAANARSTAILSLTAGQTPTFARLYWGATQAKMTGGNTASFGRPGAMAQTVTASDVAYVDRGNNLIWYQATADVTDIVKTLGAGAYRVGDIDTLAFDNVNNSGLYMGWALVVFYDDPSAPTRDLALFDGLDAVSTGTPSNATLQGFVVPNASAGFTAKLGVVAWEGDSSITGDALLFNGTALTDLENPADNFFNSTHSTLGAAVSTAGDLPQTPGTAGSMSGVDIDEVDITSLLAAGDTSAKISATSTGDSYGLGVFVTSITLLNPHITAIKSATDVNGPPLVAGDTIGYTIQVSNTGNDDAILSVLTDALPAGVTYVAQSIAVTTGATTTPLTDAPLDDAGDYDAASRTLTVRLGSGATAATGGTLAVGVSTSVSFQVTIDGGFFGPIANQASVVSAGAHGSAAVTVPTTGNPDGTGMSPTIASVDQCEDDAGCAAPNPRCDTAAMPHVCVPCLASLDCSGATPVCDVTSDACVGCKTSGALACPDAMQPVCLASGACGCTADSDCGGTMSGRICDAATSACVSGCSATAGGNGCPTGLECTAGACVKPMGMGGAAGASGSGGASGSSGQGGEAGKGGVSGSAGKGGAGMSGSSGHAGAAGESGGAPSAGNGGAAPHAGMAGAATAGHSASAGASGKGGTSGGSGHGGASGAAGKPVVIASAGMSGAAGIGGSGDDTEADDEGTPALQGAGCDIVPDRAPLTGFFLALGAVALAASRRRRRPI